MIPLTGGIESNLTPRNRKYNGGCWGLGGKRKGELLFNRYTEFQSYKVKIL